MDGTKPQVEHVIVLMLENGSFDHMFGFWPYDEKLTGHEDNPVDPAIPGLGRVAVTQNAQDAPPYEPPHDLLCVNMQLYGTPFPSAGQLVAKPPLDGFVKAAGGAKNPQSHSVMDCFRPAGLPTLRHLAEQYALCTHWYSSVPGPTWPNRFFAHCASSGGVVTNDPGKPYEMPTIFQKLEEAGRRWNIYYHDFPQALALDYLQQHADHFRAMAAFESDLAGPAFPHYAFIEPRYFDSLEARASDGHPPHDLRFTQFLIAEVYEALRRSHYWERSLLMIVFDEHGGYYDHVAPPATAPLSPASERPPFRFDRLGLRVPAILVSPWIAAGTIDATPYEHSSIPATLRKVFDLGGPLSERDRAANACDTLLALPRPRLADGDAPCVLDRPAPPPAETGAEAARRLLSDVAGSAAGAAVDAALSHQEALLALARLLRTSAGRLISEIADLTLGRSPCATAGGATALAGEDQNLPHVSEAAAAGQVQDLAARLLG